MFAGLGWVELDLLFSPNAMLAGIDGSAYKCIECTDEGTSKSIGEWRMVEGGIITSLGNSKAVYQGSTKISKSSTSCTPPTSLYHTHLHYYALRHKEVHWNQHVWIVCL
jgi:hypothetical protein